MDCIGLVPSVEPSKTEDQRRAKKLPAVAVVGVVPGFRIGFAIFLDVWKPVGVFGWPPVYCLACVVVLVATWRRDLFAGDRPRAVPEPCVCLIN